MADSLNTEKESRIEEQVFQIPYLKNPIKDARIYATFVNELAPRLALRNLSQTILESFAVPDVKAEKIVQALKLNPYYQQFFERILKFRSKRSEFASLDSGVVLLGMQNSRNILLALQSYRSSLDRHPELEESGELKFDPNEKLYFALKCEEWMNGINQKERPTSSDVAFAAGMIFDMLHWISEEWVPPALLSQGKESDAFKEHKRKFKAFCGQVFTHSLQTAAIGIELMKSVSDFQYRKFVFPMGILHDIGKVVMALVDPNYLKFSDQMRKLSVPRSLRFFAEHQQFGVNHPVLGVMACHGFKVFRPIERSLLHHHHPQLIKAEKGHYELASIISIASNMASHFRPVIGGDPLIQQWVGAELKENGIIPDRVIAEVSMKIKLPA